MNKKIMLIGSLVLILAIGLVISGCKNEESEDLGDRFNETGAVGTVSGVKMFDQDISVATHNVWVITWLAADDAAAYDIVFQQTKPTEKKNIDIIASNDSGFTPTGMQKIAPQNAKVIETTTSGSYYSDATANDNVDRWSAVVDLHALTLNAAVKGKIGVRSVPLTGQDKNNAVVWSDEIIVTVD